MANLTDAELPGYCETHCRTERALFHSSHLNRLITLAGYEPIHHLREGWHTAREDDIDPLVKLAQERIEGNTMSDKHKDAQGELPEGWEPVYLAWNEEISAWVDVGLAEYLAADTNDRRVTYEPKGVAA